MTKKVALTSDSSRTITIGAHLTDKEESTLVTFLRENSEVFVWEASGLPEVPREVIEHKLAVNTDARPVKQVRQKQSMEKLSPSPTSYRKPASSRWCLTRLG